MTGGRPAGDLLPRVNGRRLEAWSQCRGARRPQPQRGPDLPAGDRAGLGGPGESFAPRPDLGRAQVYADAFEVECSDPSTGITIWLEAMYPDELPAV